MFLPFSPLFIFFLPCFKLQMDFSSLEDRCPVLFSGTRDTQTILKVIERKSTSQVTWHSVLKRLQVRLQGLHGPLYLQVHPLKDRLGPRHVCPCALRGFVKDCDLLECVQLVNMQTAVPCTWVQVPHTGVWSWGGRECFRVPLKKSKVSKNSTFELGLLDCYEDIFVKDRGKNTLTLAWGITVNISYWVWASFGLLHWSCEWWWWAYIREWFWWSWTSIFCREVRLGDSFSSIYRTYTLAQMLYSDQFTVTSFSTRKWDSTLSHKPRNHVICLIIRVWLVFIETDTWQSWNIFDPKTKMCYL